MNYLKEDLLNIFNPQSEDRKLYIEKCFDKYNRLQGVSNKELQDMLDYAKGALHYLEIRGSRGVLLNGIRMDISSLEQMKTNRENAGKAE